MRKIFSTLLAAIMLSLSACATSPTPTADLQSAQAATQVAEIVSQSLTAAAPPTVTTMATSAETVELNSAYENAVSVEMQLLVGIFKLEGTAQAVTREQAQVLLPLWTNFQTLSQSLRPARGGPGQEQANSTPWAATDEADTQSQLKALGKQIQAALTPEQIRAISALKITQESAQMLLQEKGITLGGAQANGGNGGQLPQGTPPAGGPGGDGQPPAGNQQPGGGQMSTPQANNAGFLSTELIEALLQLLESKSAST